jgi:hypothetical protein
MGMESVIKELKQQAGFSSTFEQERLQEYTRLLLDRAKQAINLTDTKHIVLTSYDQDICRSVLTAAQRDLEQNIMQAKY